MTGNIDSFRRGATAFRNARDFAKHHRGGFIQAANARACQSRTPISQDIPGTLEENDPVPDPCEWRGWDEELQQHIADANAYDSDDWDPEEPKSGLCGSRGWPVFGPCVELHLELEQREAVEADIGSALPLPFRQRSVYPGVKSGPGSDAGQSRPPHRQRSRRQVSSGKSHTRSSAKDRRCRQRTTIHCKQSFVGITRAPSRFMSVNSKMRARKEEEDEAEGPCPAYDWPNAVNFVLLSAM